MKLPLPVLRRRLVLWYAGMFAATLLGVGFFMYFRLTRAEEREFVDGLATLSDEAAIIMELHTSEGAGLDEAAARTLAEVRPGDRLVYILRADGTPLGLPTGTGLDPRTVAAARSMDADGGGTGTFRGEAGQTWHTLGRPRVIEGERLLFLVLADRAETEATQRRILGTFMLTALLGIGALIGVGIVLVRVSMRPVQEVFDFRERFLADVAHELRAPLTVLRAQLERAERLRPDGVGERTIESARQEVVRMCRMVDDLLLLARAEAGVRQVSRVPCYLDDVVSDAVDAAAPLAAERGVRIELARYEEAPVDGDPDRLLQLVRALLDNALKFTPEGGTVTVGVGTSGHQAELTVEDTGPGIDPADLPHLFDRFYRSQGGAAGATTSGSGIGLAVVRWVAEEHGGTVEADGRPGRGARFMFRMPARSPADGKVHAGAGP